jgi:hypothetical protein
LVNAVNKFLLNWYIVVKKIFLIVYSCKVGAHDGEPALERRRQGADARGRMLRMHVRRGNPGSQDRQAGTSKQHRSLHALNAQKRLRSRNQTKEELMTTYARFIGSVEFSENKKRKRDLKFI